MKFPTALPLRISLLLVALSLQAPLTLPARTLIETGTDSSKAPTEKTLNARFHREIDGAALKPEERLVILVSANDGEVVYINQKEVGRVNMPVGPVDAKTLASSTPDKGKNGLYVRFAVPPDAVQRSGKNVIEVDVHSASPGGSLLTCDLSVKTLPPEEPLPAPSAEAKKVLETFRRTSYIDAATPIPDGYFDGGHRMALDAQDHATSGREILLVDRQHDPELAADLQFARSLKDLPPVERAHRLCLYVDKELTPPAGMSVVTATMEELEHEFVNKPLHIGDVQDQYHAGVCRHRSLLFKILAEEAGLKVALVRGKFVHIHSGGSGAHAWNELLLEDGRRMLVDCTQRPKSEFADISNPSVTSPDTAKRYVRLDGTPYYTSAH